VEEAAFEEVVLVTRSNGRRLNKSTARDLATYIKKKRAPYLYGARLFVALSFERLRRVPGDFQLSLGSS
jgi:hypothetical protein